MRLFLFLLSLVFLSRSLGSSSLFPHPLPPRKKTHLVALTSILRNEGVLALWRGAAPRALWVAPLGAMNFAGYELAKRALERGSGSGGGSGIGSETNDGEKENANEDERLKEE